MMITQSEILKLKLEFVDMLIENSSYSAFYYYHEKLLLNMSFNLTKMKQEFDKWIYKIKEIN